MSLPKNIAPYLSDNFSRGNVVLFTGAGFSVDCSSITGARLPTGSQLSAQLWKAFFPDEPIDHASSLADLFNFGRTNHRNILNDTLHSALSVESTSIPEHYGLLYSLPWHRIYTLNVDDLPNAVARAFALPRPLLHTSALISSHTSRASQPANALEVVYLNGRLEDGLDHVTFATTQYAARLNDREPLYAQCVTELLTRPVVFIGTALNESTLWQHLELRKRGPSIGREHRRKSYFVSPSLDVVKRALLVNEFNVEHVSLDTAGFCSEVLTPLAHVIPAGLAFLGHATAQGAPRSAAPRAGDLAAASPPYDPDFLLGREPQWGDIRQGLAIRRSFSTTLDTAIEQARANRDSAARIILVTGTAGTGKSTACMQAALTLEAQSVSVGWADSGIEISPHALRSSMQAEEAPPVLFIDDADRYGHDTAPLAIEISALPSMPTIVLSIRAAKVGRTIDRLTQAGANFLELSVPHLSDEDIDGLIGTLDRWNRLGVLKGASERERVEAFRSKAGRQLLVAMLEATSGQGFKDRVTDEMNELTAAAKNAYATAAIATAIRFSITRDELIQAADDPSGAIVAAIEDLLRRGLLLRVQSSEIIVRHKVIAEVLLDSLAENGSLPDLLSRLCWLAAARTSPGMSRSSRAYRRVRSLMNHEWLKARVGGDHARRIYGEIEPLLSWDHHYWLQRGSLEVELGDMGLAENCLGQAYSLAPEDTLVVTEYGYLQLKQSVSKSGRNESRELLNSGNSLLRTSILQRGNTDPHPFQILGEQNLAWSLRPDTDTDESLHVIREAILVVEDGVRRHARDNRLPRLLSDLRTRRTELLRSSSQ